MAVPFDPLKLENQICFPLYACAKENVKAYKPYLDERDLIVSITDAGKGALGTAASRRLCGSGAGKSADFIRDFV